MPGCALALSVSRICEASLILLRLYLYDYYAQVPKQRCSHPAGIPPLGPRTDRIPLASVTRFQWPSAGRLIGTSLLASPVGT